MLIIQSIILALISTMTIVALVNVFFFHSLDRRKKPTSWPAVSVLLPARNEERNLDRVLSTLTVQDYPSLEILVLDDNSDDATWTVAARWAELDQRIKLLKGEPLPKGWSGKSHACHQLAKVATGELLLFIDADTAHAPAGVSAAVAELEQSGAGLLTVIPRQTMETFWEKTILPLLHFFTFCFLPMPLVRIAKSPALAMANGQFMLFRRDVYNAIGGHEAVRTAIVEDVWLSRLVKGHGYRLAVRDGGNLVSARMYHSFGEIWDGFSKNLFAGFRYSLILMAGVVLYNVATSIAPFASYALAVFLDSAEMSWVTIVAVQVGLVLLIRLLLALRFRLDRWPALLHPIAMGVFIGIALNSVRWVLLGGGARWKGRTYDFRNQPVSKHFGNHQQ